MSAWEWALSVLLIISLATNFCYRSGNKWLRELLHNKHVDLCEHRTIVAKMRRQLQAVENALRDDEETEN